MSAGGQDVSDHLHRRIDEIEKTMESSAARVEQARALPGVLAGLVGSAETADGHVRAECGLQGLSDLVINPRAMKLMAEDLATAIKQAIAEATGDYRERSLTAMRDAGLMPSAEEQQRDLDRATRQLGTAQREFTASLRTAADAMGRAAQARQSGPTG